MLSEPRKGLQAVKGSRAIWGGGGFKAKGCCTAFCHPMCCHPQLAHHMLLQEQGCAIQPNSARTCSTQGWGHQCSSAAHGGTPRVILFLQNILAGYSRNLHSTEPQYRQRGLILPTAGAVRTRMPVLGIPADTCWCWVLNY